MNTKKDQILYGKKEKEKEEHKDKQVLQEELDKLAKHVLQKVKDGKAAEKIAEVEKATSGSSLQLSLRN